MNYDRMEDTVRKLCHSLTHEPDRWEIEVYTVRDKQSGVEYWIDQKSMSRAWNGHSRSNVFSHEQGIRVRAAFDKLCVIKATRAQQKVMHSMSPPPPKQSLFSRFFNFF